MTYTVYCVRCGKEGHRSHACKLPIIPQQKKGSQ